MANRRVLLSSVCIMALVSVLKAHALDVSSRGNIFLTAVEQPTWRGRPGLALPNLTELTLSGPNGFSLLFGATLENWTLPPMGDPQLLQIGGRDGNGVAFVDAQPYLPSPLASLMLSKQWIWGVAGRRHGIQISAGARGFAPEGPEMSRFRASAADNPEVPLGGVIGQDVTSPRNSLVEASVWSPEFKIKAAAFNGTAPPPASHDIPMGAINSMAFRITLGGPRLHLTSSWAQVANPEADQPTVGLETKWTASIAAGQDLGADSSAQLRLLWGQTTGYDNTAFLSSWGEELAVFLGSHELFNRYEILQRTPFELQIPVSGDTNAPEWVSSATLGYSYQFTEWDGLGEPVALRLGASLNIINMPADFAPTYGQSTAYSERIWIQARWKDI